MPVNIYVYIMDIHVYVYILTFSFQVSHVLDRDPVCSWPLIDPTSPYIASVWLLPLLTTLHLPRQEFEAERKPDLRRDVYLQDIHCVSSLCKAYFRELPDPLLTYRLYDKFAVSWVRGRRDGRQGSRAATSILTSHGCHVPATVLGVLGDSKALLRRRPLLLRSLQASATSVNPCPSCLHFFPMVYSPKAYRLHTAQW